MTLFIYYRNRPGNWGPIDLGSQVVRLGALSLTASAQMGDIGTSQVSFDDTAGNLGHSGDQLQAFQVIDWTETACASGNRVIARTYIRERTYHSEGSLILGAAVKIDADLADINDPAHYLVITGSDGNRPAESVGDRLTWLLGPSGYSYPDDLGLVVYPTRQMDANDYRNQTAADVFDDCAQAVGYNWFCYYRESDNDIGLWFDDPNTSTTYSSSTRISNLLSDVDSFVDTGEGATKTWPAKFMRLARNPEHLASGIVIPYASSTVYRQRTATSDIYGRVDTTTADSHIKTESQAIARATRLLWESRNEDDLLETAVDLPPAHVNDIREGQRIQVKTRNMPGYTSGFSWFRVIRRTVAQEEQTQDFYTVSLTLSPQEDAQPVVGIVQQVSCNGDSAGGADLTFPSPVTIGNILVAVLHQSENWTGDVIPPNTDLSDDNWGTGAWTELAGPGRDKTYSDTRFSRGNAIFAKVADSANQTGHVYKYQDATVYELSGYTLTGYGHLVKDLQSAATNLAVGTLTPSNGALIFCGVSQNTNTIGEMAFAAGAFTTDHEWTNVYFSAPFPCWQGHLTADGTAIATGVVSSVSYPWGGVAVSIEPA